MSTFAAQIAGLSPEKRSLLASQLPPMSYAQQRLWFIDQLEPGKAVYNIPLAVRLTGELNVRALERTLNEVVRRHQVLRTSFVVIDREPMQVIAPATPIPLSLTDLSHLNEAEREAQALSLADKEARLPFDLKTGPMLRAQLLRLADQEHVLIWTTHHIVSDGWSRAVLIKEVAALYQAFAAGEPSPLPELTIQYADFAAWQREWLSGEVLESQLNYWKEQLADAPALLELPVDRPRPPVRHHYGALRTFRLSEELSEKLKELSRSEGATLFMVLLAAFDLLLARYTGQKDILVGTTVAGRNRTEIEHLIGFFINALVLRVKLEPELSFRELVRRVREVALGAYAHQDIPFEKLVEELQPERALSHQPLFQVVFGLENAPREELVLPGIKLSTIKSEVRTAKFDLQLDMSDTGGVLGGTWTYSTDIFEETTIARLDSDFQRLLATVVADPEVRIGAVELLSEAERQQLLVEWNETARPYPSESSVVELFERQVAETPEGVALIYQEQQVSYEELNERANQLAHYLRRLGVGPEVMVGLCIERSVEMVVGVLAILKAGGAYVPLDVSYPAERLRYMLEDAGISVVLTRERALEQLPVHFAQVVCVDTEWEQIALESRERVESGVNGENLAYVIYTSGSTGQPKGVQIEHRGLLNYVRWASETYPFGDGRTPVHSSLSFDLTVTSLYVPLVRGGTLELLPDKTLALSTALGRGNEFDVIKLTPGQLQLLNSEVKTTPLVQALVLGGENLLADTVRQWRELNPQTRIFNEYGPTETVVGCCIYESTPAAETAVSVPIGGPIANTEIYILDGLELVPVGATGEICIGGAGVARGYLGRPDLSAERFIPNPFSLRPGERLYRTGDLGRYRSDSTLEYLGRMDHQVKVRGYRIELGEIEAVLGQHSDVRECVVTARKDQSGGNQLVGYVVTHANGNRNYSRPLYEMPNGLKVAHLNKNETDFVYDEIFAKECYLKHGIALHEGACIFDVGANIGLFSLFIHQRVRGAQVYAFEPAPPVFDLLRSNVELYGLDVKAFNFGLFSEPTTLKFTYYPRMSVMSGAFADAVMDEEIARTTMKNTDAILTEYADDLMAGRFSVENYDCQVRTISDVIAEQGVQRIDLLKIDVEKTELEVLKGIEEQDWQKIDQIVVEVHDINEQLEEVERLLGRHGFTIVRDQDPILKGTGIYDIYAVHPARITAERGAPGEPIDLRSRLINSLGMELRRYLQERVPEYMIPSLFVELQELPLTRNGKVDRQALPAPGESLFAAVDEYEPPRPGVGELIAGIWSEVLQVEQVGGKDNFFDLGGHSLLATQMVSRVREVCGVEIGLRQLFEAPLLRDFSAHVEEMMRAGENVTVPPLRRVDREQQLPLSFAQQRLWFIDQLESDKPLYNVPMGVRLNGELNITALEQTLSEVVRRHEVLRTSFSIIDGEPVQVISPPSPIIPAFTDLSGFDEAERKAEARRLANEEARRLFDLSTGPMLRAQLLRLGETEHVLLCTMHHIVSDGWSMGLLVKEVATLYRAFAAGETSPIPELTIQYADFAVWQRQWLTGDVLEQQLSYWKQQLHGAPAVLELPTDRPRPAVRGYRSARHHFRLSQELTPALNELARREGATLFMVLLAAFDVLLSRYTRQQDIVVGTDIANRNRAEIEQLMGFFVNQLVMRTDMSGDPDFSEVVHRVREVALGAYAHQDIPFEKLVEELQPERDLSRSPLFQVKFLLNHEAGSPLELPGLKISSVAGDTDTLPFDLVLMMFESGRQLTGVWSYNTDLFEAETVARIARHFGTLLEVIVAAPNQSVGTLSFLSVEEREQLIVGWNDTKKNYPRQKTFHQLFEEQVEQRPDAQALVYEDQRLSYAELNRRANQLAHYLRTIGVGPEVVVGICMERSLELVVGLLGILKAGGAYLPLDPAYPGERLRFMLEDAGAPVLLTQQRWRGQLPEYAGVVISVDSDWPLISQQAVENLEPQVSDEHLAYVIYTSGSTGQPKGVMITHEGMRNRLLWMQEAYQLTAADRILQKTPYNFDVSVWEFFWPLITGAGLVLARPGGHQDSSYLVQLIQQQGITITHFVPSMLQAWLQREGVSECDSLRVVICSGEALSYNLQEEYFAKLKAELHNLYGPTEASVDVSYWRCQRGQAVVIGRPIANLQLYIVDEWMEPVPVGVAGELLIGGVGLGRGYLQRPELTAEKFVPHPFSTEAGARLYRSGDRARYRSDGEIEYLGRLDDQVKVRGYRIELGEIEAALSWHEGVRECVVVARADESGAQRLIAYLVPSGSAAPNNNTLRTFLKGLLPDYMIPATFVQLEQIPLTPNGKVDRRALPAPSSLRPELESTFISARTPIEEVMVGIWREVLGVAQVGIHDNFFDLGGHSLLATQVISRLRDVLGIEVGLRSLFSFPNIAELARSVEAEIQMEHGLTAPPVSTANREERLRLSFAQERLWFIDQLEPGKPLYNIPLGVRLSGELNVNALEQTLSEVIRRHEVLRTSFTMIDNEPVQVIAPPAPFHISVTDLTTFNEEEREAEVRRLADEEERGPFNLGTAPMLRVQLLRLAETEHVLFCTIHHIASDGWSMGLLLKEVATLYRAFTAGEPSPLPELTIQYADFAAWQREWLSGEVLDRQLSYWKQQLEGAPVLLELPTDRPRPPVRNYRGARCDFRLTQQLSENLKELARREGATLFMVLLAAFDVLLSRYSGQEDIVVGTDIANRNRAETEQLIGFFVNQLVLRTDMSGNPSFREVLRRVREVALGAYAHQDIPFEKLVEELQPQRDLGRSPLFQVKLVLQNASRGALHLPGLELSTTPNSSGIAHLDLTLVMSERGKQLDGTWSYSSDLFDAATIDRLAGHFQILLETIAANPEQDVSSLPLLSTTEREQLLTWNQTGKAYPADKCVQQLFEQQVEQRPNAVAVVYEDEQLTYAELNARANQLAHHLRTLGVGPEVVVAICMERSVELIVGLLGILKAGGAYLPLDAASPRERLQYMLEDAGAGVLLTQQQLEASLPAYWGPIICLDSDWAELAQQATENPECMTGAENLCYVTYTSGSTGQPKGVLIPHRGVTRLLCNVDYARLDETRVLLQLAPLAFDASTFEVWGALVHGGCCVLWPGRVPNAADLREAIEQHGVTTMWLTASLFNAVVDEAAEALTGLEQLLIGGEALSVNHVRRAQAALPGVQIINGYGPTESTTFTCCEAIGEVASGARRIAIGKPIANTEVYVVDGAGVIVPVGVVGELYIGGAGLGRGYLQQPELTAAKFVPDGLSGRAGERLYRTGDLVRYQSDGKLEFLERVDEQVKVRGHRIELGEVEAVLSQHSAVKECVVIVREDEPGDKRLVAYLATEDGAGTGQEWRSYLKQRLPEYMIPGAFVELEQLPLNRNGKVDRQALPRPEAEELRVGEYQAPRTAIEEMVAGIWSEVLKLARVGRSDNFFELGGHSLLATQVISRVRKMFAVEIPLRLMFESQTLAEFALGIEAMLAGGEAMAAPAITALEGDGPVPLSFAQQRLWFIDQLEPGSSAYNIPVAVRLSGELNVTVLERTLSEVVRRHEALRTSFSMTDGEPVQVIAPALPITIPITDLSTIDQEEREAKARWLAKEEARCPFDLATGPVLRVQLLRLADREHVLLCTMHHIVSDGWSMGLLIKEVATLYQAFSAGKPSPLPELTIQYGDFAAWQRQWLSGDRLEKQLAYWKQQLQGAPALLELPTDRPRLPVRSYRGAHVPLKFSIELTEALKQLTGKEDATLFMVLLAAFDLLLSRYSGQKDIVVGTPIANRNRFETEQLIGFFVNTVVLRVEIDGSATFKQLVQQVRERALGAYANQDLPFEQLIDELRLERDLSYTPLFQVMFALQNAPAGSLKLNELSLSPLDVAEETAKYDLLLTLGETEQGLMGSFQYSTDLFDAETINRLVGHYRSLLESVVAHPDETLSALTMMDENEQQQLTVGWNETRVEYPSAKAVQQLFEQQVEQHPAAVALVAGAEKLSYAELNVRANQLAHYLRELGVGPEVLVAICMERSVEQVVSVLGVLKAGGAYLPLDAKLPQERLQFMLNDAAPRVLLTQERLAERLPAYSGQTIYIDSEAAALGQQASHNPACVSGPEDLCYVIYTSGSTGRPKGVAIEQRGLLNYLHWSRQAYEYAAGGCTPLHSSLSFDMAVTSLYVPLVSGGTVELLSEEVEALAAALESGREYELLKLTPGHLQILNWSGTPTAVKKLVVGGENLLSETVWQWLEKNGQTRVFNEYGPTETVVGSSVYEVVAAGRSGSVAIGRPVANTEVYVLDEAQQPAPLGVVGELYIGGAGVARGYLHQPELTAERFVPDEFSGREGARLYRTGDLVRYRADGQLEYLGRVDEQVKVRGYRVELGEIEATLRQHQRVKECVVLARAEESRDKRLVGYVVLAETLPEPWQEFRTYLQERLPEYMIPTAWVPLEELPLTRNGKVDRRALPAPEPISRPESNEYCAPATPVEVALANIWSGVLHVENVSVHDNFFALGGDSILVIQVVARAREFGISLSPKLIFQHQTISKLAAVAQNVSGVVAEQGRVTGDVLLTPIQQHFFARELPDRHHYNQSVMLEVDEHVDVSSMKRAVEKLLLGHDALRSRFVLEQSGWRQFILADEKAEVFSQTDFSHLPQAERSSALELEAERLQRSLALTKGPLVRVALCKMGDGQPQRLIIVIHHLVVDGVSWRILLEDLQTSYQRLREGKVVHLPPKTTSFKAWSERLSEHARSVAIRKEIDHWLTAPYTVARSLPRDFVVGKNTIESSRSLSVSLGTNETEALLRDLPNAFHTRINEVLLTALGLAFAAWTTEHTLLVDIEGHGREEIDPEVDLSRTVGWFTSIFPVLLDVRETPTHVEALKQVKEQLRKVPNNGIGYGLLRFLSNEEEIVQKLAGLPQAEVIFNYLGQVDQVVAASSSMFKVARESIGANSSTRGRRTHLFEINSIVAGGRLRVNWTYSENIHRRTTVEGLAEKYIAILRELIQHSSSAVAPGFTPSDFPDANLTQKSLDRLIAKAGQADATKV